MQKLLRLVGTSLLALTFFTGLAPDAEAKKSRSSAKKIVKSKKSSRGKVSRSSKKGSSKKISRRRGSSSQRESPIASRQVAGQNGESESQEESTPPMPRAVTNGIPPDRVMEIQSALTKAGYYSGDVTGVYDETTKQAMKQYQQANSLNASGLPSAHSLKKLGVSKRSNASAATPIKKAADGE